MLLLARYAHSAEINVTYEKFAFPLFQGQIAVCKIKTCIKFKFW